MKLHQANPASTWLGQQELPGNSNYFSGPDPKAWQTNIPAYARVKYEAVYDRIDPVITYATFFGTLPATAIAVVKEGNAIVAGQVAATPGAYQNGSGQSVVKLNASGTAVLFLATFNAGDGGQINGLALDPQGKIYVTGQTTTSLFPTTPGAFQPDFGLTGGNFANAFVMKLNAQGLP